MVYETWLKSDLKKPMRVQPLTGNLFSADNNGNLIGVEVLDNGQPAQLTGAVTGYVIRSDGATVMVTGTLSDNKASIVLPASAYIVVGQISIVIKVGTVTVGACVSNVYRTSTDTLVDPGHVIPDISELLAEIENMRTATAAANTATTNANAATSNANTAANTANAAASNANDKATLANTAATTANTSAENADTKAGLANTAAGNANDAASAANTAAQTANTAAENADTATANANAATTAANTAAGTANTAAANADEKATIANTAAGTANASATAADTATAAANTAAGKIDNMTVAATTSPEGSQASVTITEVNGHKHVAFGIPKGDKGKDFHIAFTFASIAAMEAYSGDIELFDYAMIDTGNVQDADTGKLYCYEQDDEWHYIGDLSGAQGIKGETGTGIDRVALNADYTLTIYYDDGTSDTIPSIRGATGITPAISIGSVSTLLPGQQAFVNLDPTSTPENPVFNFGIPKGDTGSVENINATVIPMSESDSTTVKSAIDSKVDQVAGKGLSSEDYTSAEKTKLQGIENGAQVNPEAFTGASASDAGSTGLVPAPVQGSQNKVLKGDGTWGDGLSPDDVVNNLTTTTAGKVLDARQGKALNDEIGSAFENIAKLRDGVAIIVDGDTASVAVPVGGYAYIKNNTHGLAEGMYKNTSSSAFPVSGGTANSTVFTTVPTGVVNDAVTSLNSKLTSCLIGETLTVSGTTDAGGRITINKTKRYSGVPAVFSNVSHDFGTPYSVTMDSITTTTVALRIRSLVDNSAITNTSVNFDVLLFGIEAS